MESSFYVLLSLWPSFCMVGVNQSVRCGAYTPARYQRPRRGCLDGENTLCVST